MQAVPNEMGPLQFAAGSHTHDLGWYVLNASHCGCIAAMSYGCTNNYTLASHCGCIAAMSYGCTNNYTLAIDCYTCPCVCASQSSQVSRLLPVAEICCQSRLYALVAVASTVAYAITDHDCMVHVVARCQSAMSDLCKLMMIRDLGIGGQAHKKIDAAVKQGGFEIISEPFELGEKADVAAQVQSFEGASHASCTPLSYI